MARALLIVDVQEDFLPPAGALAVPGGDAVLEPIAALMRSGDFEFVIATRDWHPPDHRSFAAQGGPWPAHCVRDTPGAQLSAALDRARIDAVVDKGTSPEQEGYSAFEATELHGLLREERVDAVTVAGLATDWCVSRTARDALREGLRVTIATDAIRGIDGDASRRALAELVRTGAALA